MATPLTGRLFSRTAQAVITAPGATQSRLVGVRMKFTVQKISKGFGNTASIDFYNLAPQSRAALEESHTKVSLVAGYAGQTRELYNGDVFISTSKRNGADIVTTTELLGGGIVSQTCVVSVNVGPGGTNRDVLDQAINAAIASDPTLKRGTVQDLPLIQYQKGFSETAQFSEIMDYLVDAPDWVWTIQDGVINVCPINGGTGGGGFLLTPDTGLIDVPSKDVEGFLGGGSPLYHFKSLLNPIMNPLDFVSVQSSYVPHGNYQIYYLQHMGDTFEGEYATLMEAFFRGGSIV